VILGLGYDNSLGDKIGITLIATGFEFHDPFTRLNAPQQMQQPAEAPKPEKIIMTLNTGEEEEQKPEPVAAAEPIDPMAPTLVEDYVPQPVAQAMPQQQVQPQHHPQPQTQSQPQLQVNPAPATPAKEEGQLYMQLKIKDEAQAAPAVDPEQMEWEARKKALDEKFAQLHKTIIAQANTPKEDKVQQPPSATSGGYLARPSNIYADKKGDVSAPRTGENPLAKPAPKQEEDENFHMELVIRNDNAGREEPQALAPQQPTADEMAMHELVEEQKRRAAERLQKLRNLSFNVNTADPNNEFETVPAYIRRNMELSSNTSSVENFYSNYSVKPDGMGNTHISTINSFLDGKKPD
jgi:cell division protein FtsZ